MFHSAEARLRSRSPNRAAGSARAALMRMRRPHGGFDASRYFRNTDALRFLNVGTVAVRQLATDIARQHADEWRIGEAQAFADTLMPDRHLEVKGLAIEVLARYRREFTPALLPRWKRWLTQNHSSNWATTDSLCGSLIGPLLVAHPGLVRTVALWRTHRNLWVRRASAVALLNSIRLGRALNEAYVVAGALHDDPEDLIQKAVGWMLREAGKIDPERLERYLITNGHRVPRTTVRYAIERFSETKRRALLKATV